MGRKPWSELKIVEAILENGPLTFSEIVKLTKLPKATVSHAIRRLAEKEFIQPRMFRGKIIWELTERAILHIPMPSRSSKRSGLTAEELKMYHKMFITPLEQWDQAVWEFIYKDSNFKKEEEISPELKQKLDQVRDILVKGWPMIKADFTFHFVRGLMLGAILLDKLNDKEELARFKHIFLPRVGESHAALVKDYLLSIWNAVWGEKLKDV